MPEKCTHSLPPLRVSDSLAKALMTLAANDERSLSDYLRMVLTHHAYGHAGTVPREAGAGE
jgi:predicted HicB family RNase H-like nuclease